MRRRAMITSAFTCASVLLLVVGVHPAAAASSPAEVLQQQGFAAFEWYPLSQANAKVSDQRLNFLRRDGFKTIYADISEYLGVADQPDSRTQRTRLSQLTSDLIGRVFLPRSAWSGSCSSVGVRGMASLPSRQTASLSSATPGAPRPADRLQGHARSKGRTMRHRQHGPRHPASEHAIESRSRRCSWDGTGPAPHTT
jgi:hypothetical protein